MSNLSANVVIPFVDGLKSTLEQFGVTDITRSDLKLKKSMFMDHEVCVIIGLTHDITGNIGYSMPAKTAMSLASVMMGGMPVDKMDEMTKSAVCEVSNMMAAGAIQKLSGENKIMDISPPTVVAGNNMIMIISQVQTISLTASTSVGPIQINVGIESMK